MNDIKGILLKYWVEFILGGLITWVALFYKKYIATQDGVQALLRAEIVKVYNKYIELGYLPIYERANLEELFKQYKSLGGNGVVAGLVEKLFESPTEHKEV